MPDNDPSKGHDSGSSEGNRNGPSTDSSLDERLDRLKSKLETTQIDRKHLSNESVGNVRAGGAGGANGVGQAFRLSSEFIAGVVVGAGIGYLVDTFFGTSPWGMIVFFLLGFAAAILNVMRAAGMIAELQMRLKPAQDLHNPPQEGESDDQAKK